MNNKAKENEFKSIKYNFENRSFFIGSENLGNYNRKYKNYYIEYIILNADKIKNYLYLSELVCFTMDNNIFDKRIIKTWFNLLFTNKNRLVLLCILDYFNVCPLKKLPVFYEKKILKLSKERNFKIVKNQIYINLLSLDEFNANYKMLLFHSLKSTNDYRSFFRIISSLFLFNSKDLVNEIKVELIKLSNNFRDTEIREYILKNCS